MNKNLISILDISKSEILNLFEIAHMGNKIFTEYPDVLKDKVLASLFFQPSTRTQLSFQSSFIRLGGKYIGFSNINESRSGPPYYEPVDDLGKIVSLYCDVIVMRTIEQNKMLELCETATVPIISAGSGNVEHPTQTLTDLYTIQKCHGSISNNNILIVGTPRQRTINSFLIGLNYWDNINIHILCQEGVEISTRVKQYTPKHSIKYYNSIEQLMDSNILNSISVLYMDKIFYETEINNNFVMNTNQWQMLKNDVIILHPLPRTNELPKYIDTMPQAKYFYQAENGLYMRSALYLHLFGFV